jgi:hypothetical protein
MLDDSDLAPEQFARAFQNFLDWVPTAAGREGPFAVALKQHFGADPSRFPATMFKFADYDRPNVQVALDAYLAEPGRSAELLGFSSTFMHLEASFSLLVAKGRSGMTPEPGPVGRTMVEIEGGSIACVTAGLFLVNDGDDRIAVLVASQRYPSESSFVEVMAPQVGPAERFLAELRTLMREHNVFRQKVISLAGGQGAGGSGIGVTFHRRRRVEREQIVLAGGLLERVERSTVEFDRHAAKLRDRGHHMRRGLLLHGPPGTGKTLTATYLAGALEDRTTIVLTGPALALVRASCRMARNLQPAMVIFEDIDLIAQERTAMSTGATSLLFELLNEIDGVGEDADVIFVMTTNRADLLEPALAARPGRVDQAVEFPLPDAASRARLIRLFCEGLEVDELDVDSLVEQTEDASPAFLRELVRKAALHAAIADAGAIGPAHFAAALSELEEGGRLTRTILGAGAAEAAAAGQAIAPPRKSC